MPAWWEARRFGLHVDASLACVPAWAPIGEDASAYRAHLGEDDGPPMIEVVTHHRERWGHIARFEDFLELLRFDRFDPDAWAELAVAAGAGYTVAVAQHDDGVCWWDAPGAPHTTVERGPSRNVIAEVSAACARHDIVFGAHHRSARARGGDDDLDVVVRQVQDLTERFGPQLLCGDQRLGNGRDDGTRDALDRLDTLIAKLHAIAPELVVDDCWCPPTIGADDRAVVRAVDELPTGIDPRPWELRRSIGRGIGHNRTDRVEHLLDGAAIVALLTDVVARGGHLLLTVGAQLDGTIPEMYAAPLRDAGSWIRVHHDVVSRSRPWNDPGDGAVRYVTIDGVLHAIDVAGTGCFRALDGRSDRVTGVERVGPAGAHPVAFRQDGDGLQLELPRPSSWRRNNRGVGGGTDSPGAGVPAVGIAVYRIGLEPVERPVELFEPVARDARELGPLLAAAGPGDIVRLGDGTYHGDATVPADVTVRGLGPSRTRIDGALRAGRNSRIEHLTLAPSGDEPALVVEGPFASVLGCEITGDVVVAADDVLLRASTLATVRSSDVDRLTVSRCQLRGRRAAVGVRVDGGADHEIDSCEFRGHQCAVRVTGTVGTVVRGNDIEAGRWGVHLQRTERAHAHGNRIGNTMRAVDVDGGVGAVVDGNVALDGDSGCVVQRGAADCHVAGNHWERCRIGLLAWNATGLHHQDNHVQSLHEPDHAVVVGR